MKFDLRAPLVWGASLVLMSSALAQENSPPSPSRARTAAQAEGETVTLENFIVTGSNIRRIEQERVLPVTIYDRDDLDARGASTPVELFEFLPSAGELPISEEGTLGAAARGDVASISVRSIGSSSTLTLLNGRRLAPHPISQAESGVPSLAVNINTLPGAAIQRIEVLRDGASAIYGTDAAAGVVNAILDTDADGTRLQLRGAVTEVGGAGERRVTLSDGRFLNAGRTKVRFTLDYFHRDLLMAAERDFAADADMRRLMVPPWNGVPIETPLGTLRDNDYSNRSTSSNYGNYIRGTFNALTGEFEGRRPDSNRGIVTASGSNFLTTRTNTTTAGYPGEFYLVPLADGSVGSRQTSPSNNVEGVEREWYYNLNQDRHLLPATDRYNVTGIIEHELTERLTAFGEVMYYHADSQLFRDPASFDATDDPNIFIPATNPWNPFGTAFYHPTGANGRVRGNPGDVLFTYGTGVRPREFRRKEAYVESRAGRVVGGIRGKLAKEWEWEAAGLYAWARTQDLEKWNIRESKLREALARTDETAFNPFGYTFKIVPNDGTIPNAGTVATNPLLIQVDQPYTNPASVVSELYDDFLRIGRTSIASADFKTNGPVTEIAGRTIRAAAGAEFRYETYEDWRPEYHGVNPAGSSLSNPYLREGDNDFIGLSPNLNLDASREIWAGFTELLVPIVAPKHRVPLVRGLEFTAAARYERFSDFGDTFKPKYGVNWRVANWLGVRASYNESFRAPNLPQTNPSPLQRSVSSVTDRYRLTVTGSLADGSRSRTVVRGDTKSLRPEEAENFTIGVVVEVPQVRGLSFTADYWRLKQSGVIATLGATTQLDRDRDLLDAFTAAAIAAGQDPNTLDLGSGTAAYVGNRNVRRAPVTAADLAAFQAYNAANPNSRRAPVGRVISLSDDYFNMAGRDLEGVDLAMQYRSPKTRWGSISFRAEAAWLGKFLEQVDAQSIVEDNLNENGITRWKANGSVTWRYGKWTTAWFTQFVKGTVDTSAALGAGGDSPTDPALLDAVVAALGYPDYLHPFTDSSGAVRLGYLVDDWIVHNSYVQYRFGRQKNLLDSLTVRVGVNNVLDTAPPLADESRGYRTGGSNPRGRQYYMQLTKAF